MSSDCEMPEPTAEHNRLMGSVGTWDVTCKVYMDPGSPPAESQATDTIEAIGPFWVVSAYRGEFFGAPYRGQCQVGYNVEKKCYTSTWIDQMSPLMIQMEGNFDEAGTCLTMRGEGPGMTGELVTWKLVENHIDENSKESKMFIEAPDGDVLLFEWVYTRQA